MSTISFADALKAFRRGVHQNGKGWRCVVIAKDSAQLLRAWGEARFVLEAGSVPVETCNVTTRSIHMVGGAIMRFFVLPSVDVAQMTIPGMEFTQIIWLFEPSPDLFHYVKTRKRSLDVKSGLRTDMSEY